MLFAHRRFVLALLFLSASSLIAGRVAGQDDGARLAPNQPIPPAELEAFIDGYVSAAMAEHQIAGVTVSVVQDGAVVLSKGYGFADFETGRRVDPNTTLFRIGSITKTFTWIEIMRLVEAGKISLDDDVNDHLPLQLQVPAQGFDAPIRVRDLMTHQPGFEDRALGVLFVREPQDIRPLNEFLAETRPNRVRPPGELSSYSNYGAALAGAIVEHETGRNWQDIVEESILTPLGMAHTSTREPYPARGDLPAPMSKRLARDVSLGYRPSGAGHEAQSYEYITQIAPAGVVSSTGGDMARYMLMLLDDGRLGDARIFGERAAKTFRTPMTSLAPEIGNWDGGFIDVVGPGGFESYGHDGGTLTFFSNMNVVPELGFGLFVSTNTAGGAALSGSLWGAVVKHFYAPPTPPPVAGDPGRLAAMAAYAGAYLPTRRQYEGLAGFVMRLRTVRVGVSPEGYLTIAGGARPQRFVPTDEPDRFRNANGPGLLVFERRDGRLVLPTPGVALEKVGPLQSPGTLLSVAVLAVLASVATLLGVWVRSRRGLPKTRIQARAAQLQVGTALLWLAGLASIGTFAARAASNLNALVYDWPTVPILAFSTLSLLASLASAGTLVLLPGIWRGDGGWTRGRKARFTLTAVVFAALAALLLGWGALQPWSP